MPSEQYRADIQNYRRRSREEHNRRMQSNPAYRKKHKESEIGAFGAVAVVGGLVIAAPFIGNHDKAPAQHQQPATPHEKVGGHHGETGTERPGTGILKTEKGTYSLGTAVAAEAHDGGPIVERTVK